jgi:hypothetical protein
MLQCFGRYLLPNRENVNCATSAQTKNASSG